MPIMQSAAETSSVMTQIREIVAANAGLNVDVASLADDASLYDAGMDSHSSVNLMIALEGALDIEFPNRMLTRAVFTSIRSIATAVEQVRQC